MCVCVCVYACKCLCDFHQTCHKMQGVCQQTSSSSSTDGCVVNDYLPQTTFRHPFSSPQFGYFFFFKWLDHDVITVPAPGCSCRSLSSKRWLSFICSEICVCSWLMRTSTARSSSSSWCTARLHHVKCTQQDYIM